MTDSSSADHHVTPEQLAVWRGLARAHARVVRRLDDDLASQHGLSLAWYDVLARLVEADGRRLRMTDLAERVLLSPSGLTRLVDRMAEEGLVQRVQAEGDGRGLYAVLTEAGYERLREASGTHLRGVHEYVISRFDDDELAAIAEYLDRLDD